MKIITLISGRTGSASSCSWESLFWITPEEGTPVLVRYKGMRHDPNGNGTGNYQNRETAEVLSPEDLPLDENVELPEIVLQLLTEHKGNGTRKLDVDNAVKRRTEVYYPSNLLG